MDIGQLVLSVKDNRKKERKTRLNVTVSTARLNNINNAFSEQSALFKMLTDSQRLDLYLYVLERFLGNSDLVNLKVES